MAIRRTSETLITTGWQCIKRRRLLLRLQKRRKCQEMGKTPIVTKHVIGATLCICNNTNNKMCGLNLTAFWYLPQRLCTPPTALEAVRPWHLHRGNGQLHQLACMVGLTPVSVGLAQQRVPAPLTGCCRAGREAAETGTCTPCSPFRGRAVALIGRHRRTGAIGPRALVLAGPAVGHRHCIWRQMD